jgi:hypothetical protein
VLATAFWRRTLGGAIGRHHRGDGGRHVPLDYLLTHYTPYATLLIAGRSVPTGMA